MLTREPWLGDALRALRALAPDDEATARQILAMLSLPLAAPEAAMPSASAPPPPAAQAQADGASAADVAAPAVPREAGAGGARADAGWRLPSRLVESKAAQTPSPPVWLSSTPPLALTPSLVRPRAATPLMPRQRRRAILNALLHEEVEEGGPDVARIVATLGRGRSLARVPLQVRRTLRHGVELRPDRAPWLRAFHADQTELREALTRLLPPGRVSVVTIDGAPEPRPGRRRLPANPADAPRSSAPTPILLLSDLGLAYRGEGEPPASLRQWQAWLLRQRRAGRRSVVLSPLPLPQLTAFAATLMPWSERASIGDAWRARAGQAPAPAETLGDDAMRALAQSLSPAIVISPALLRSTRLSLSLPPAAEAELLAEGPVASHGPGGTSLAPAAVRALRAQLARSDQLEPALQRVASEGHERQDGSAIEEALIALELRGRLDDNTAEQALRPALAALARGGSVASAMADWAAHAWTRMSAQARATQAARQLGFAAAREQLMAARHRGGTAATGWLTTGDGAEGGLPVLAPWLGGSGSGRLAWSVQLRRYGDGTDNLVFGPVAEPARRLHHIELPDAAPWLQLRFEGRQWVLPLVGGAVNGEVSFDVTGFDSGDSIDLAAADGRRWELSRASVEEMLRESSFTLPRNLGVALCLAPGLAFAVRLPQASTANSPDVSKQRGAPASAEPSQAAEAEWVLKRDDGMPVTVRVLEVLRLAGGDERLALAFSPPDAWRPFESQVHYSSASGLVDVLFSIDTQREVQTVLLRRVGQGHEAAISRRDAATSLRLLDRVGRDWSWAERVLERRASKVPQPGDTVTIDSIESQGLDAMGEWLQLCARKRFALWLLATEHFGAEPAGLICDQLRRRFPTHRIEVPGAPPRDAAQAGPGSIVLILGSGRIDDARQKTALEVARSGGIVLWAPLPLMDDPSSVSLVERIRAQWAPELAEHVLQRKAFDNVHGTDQLVDEVARWLELRGQDSPPGTATAQAAPLPADAPAASPQATAPRPTAGSLRQRLVTMIENREERDLGLFRIDLSNGLALTPVSTLSADRPVLLFVHGIAGSTADNFGPLLADASALAALSGRYGDAMFAWHYRSLSVGPLANALALVRVLPPGLQLHLVTYSAGGVIGELLCRGMRSDGRQPIDLPDLKRWSRSGRIDPDFEDDQAGLNNELLTRRLRIERFVRIAAPMEGSVIYGGGRRSTLKLARAVPWIGGIVAALPGVESLLTDPTTVPGAAAMVPGAGVQALLTRDVRVSAPLSVIAGVHEAQSFSARASAWWADLFGGAESDAAPSDLWVSLPSALAGLEREGGIEYFIERGEQVDHATYLRLASVRERVVAALLSEGRPSPGFAFARSMEDLRAQATHPPAAAP